jgi:hypothetical protein
MTIKIGWLPAIVTLGLTTLMIARRRAKPRRLPPAGRGDEMRQPRRDHVVTHWQPGPV